MSLVLYNTITRKKEPFTPLHKDKVHWYNCGPTVYNYIHIGNARSAVSFDIIRRYLEWKGFSVNFMQNFTDIDDKIIKAAHEEKISTEALTKKYIDAYNADADALRIKPATVHPKATEHVEGMIDMIETLIKKGYAYATEDGVYFDVERFKEYGKLSNQSVENLKKGARIPVDEKKKSAVDFALWKKAKPGEPSWESPWMPGRPGWHIECSVMSAKHGATTIDIHSGGEDLVFPHHENEIAQSESCSGKEFAKYWLHNGFLTINKEKMSKSLGNFFTAREVLSKYDPRAVRYLLASSHYRSKIDFSEEALTASKVVTDRFLQFLNVLRNIKDGTHNAGITATIAKAKEEFEAEMDDDFNMPKALAILFEFMRDINTLIADSKIDAADAKEIIAFMQDIDSILCIMQQDGSSSTIDEEIESLIRQREDARKNKEWKKSDEIRDLLKAKGIILEDSKDGVRWKKA